MSILEILVVAVYSLCLVFIFCYSLAQLHLTLLYWLGKRRRPAAPAALAYHSLPSVTVQLPVYNERYVIARLLDAVAAFDYPRHLLEVQVLDDSTDDTTAIIAQKLRALQSSGIRLQHLRRKVREGYKAGALQHGLPLASGEYIAIFDADFVPPPDFLRKTLAHFTSPQVGMVQTRWSHLNVSYSLLTRLQAFGLDAHFSVEQSGRHQGGHFMNFNGTAGVWRRTCIETAGGWQADTLTEDLDLSYRAQLNGWQFVYLETAAAPAELPAAMGALKSQQFRWTKGAAETARKHLGQVLRAPLGWATKTHAVFHLLNSGVFVCVLVTALLSIPLLYIKQHAPAVSFLFKLGPLLLVSLLFLVFFYWTALYQQTRSFWRTTRRFCQDFFLFLSMSMGLSLHNSIAVAEGYLGKKSPFIRTPKYNLVQPRDSWKQQAYFMQSISIVTWLEGLLSIYFLFGIGYGIWLQDYSFLPMHLLLMMGFGAIFGYSIAHSTRS